MTEVEYLVNKIRYQKMQIELKKNELQVINNLVDKIDEYLGVIKDFKKEELQQTYFELLNYYNSTEDELASTIESLNYYLERYKEHTGVEFNEENWV